MIGLKTKHVDCLKLSELRYMPKAASCPSRLLMINIELIPFQHTYTVIICAKCRSFICTRFIDIKQWSLQLRCRGQFILRHCRGMLFLKPSCINNNVKAPNNIIMYKIDTATKHHYLKTSNTTLVWVRPQWKGGG